MHVKRKIEWRTPKCTDGMRNNLWRFSCSNFFYSFIKYDQSVTERGTSPVQNSVARAFVISTTPRRDDLLPSAPPHIELSTAFHLRFKSIQLYDFAHKLVLVFSLLPLRAGCCCFRHVFGDLHPYPPYLSSIHQVFLFRSWSSNELHLLHSVVFSFAKRQLLFFFKSTFFITFILIFFFTLRLVIF